MLNLVIKDILIQKRSLIVAIFYIFFFVFVFQSIGPLMYTSAIIAFTYILVMGAFACDDKNKTDIMLNSLPVKRINVVAAKYTSIFMYLAIGTAAYIIICYILSAANLPFKIYPVTLEGAAGAIFGVSLMNSIYFPLLFKIGYNRAKVLNIIIFLSFFFGLPWVVNFINEKANNSLSASIMDFLKNQPDAVIGSGIIAAAILILLASYLLSVKLYKQRDF